VTFSGGGGSGAAAYATVGSGTVVRSLGGFSDLTVDTTPILHLRAKNTSGGNPTNATAAFGLIPPQSNFGAPIFGTISSPYFIWGGTGTSFFMSAATSPQTTGNTGTSQFAIAHTTSAVNYVQVTGAATGGVPTISAQGSDANPSIILQAKGSGTATLQAISGNALLATDGGLTAIRAIPRAASGDTWLDVQRNVGFVDIAAASGVTNGDVRLTPKGTGNVRFGTYTASMALTVQGYIEIKDSGGTVRKLAVIA
jgi:hypothetical protein